MKLPWDTAAKWFGGTLGVVAGLFAMVLWGNAADGGIRCSQDTTAVVRPNTIDLSGGGPHESWDSTHTNYHLMGLEESVDSLIAEIAKRDSLLAAAVSDGLQPIIDRWEWRVDRGDSISVMGHAAYDYVPIEGILVRNVWVDSLIVPEHIIRITETILVETGLDWYWIPVAAIVAFLIGWAV